MSTSTSDRIAILLNSMGGEITTDLLEQLPNDVSTKMTAKLQQLERIPPESKDIENVIEEFTRFLEFALANADLVDEKASKEPAAKEEPIEEFEVTDDPYEDVKRLQDYQLAGFLRHETGLTTAMVLGTLSNDRIGRVMELLPEDLRTSTFLRLQAPRTVPTALSVRIAEKTVEIASRLDADAAEDPDSLADENTATLLRSMDRATRGEMFAALEKEKPEVAERVKSLLFLFEDIKDITDKSIQKLLAEVDSSGLAVALKTADPQITERITSNLSKRAKAGLIEEIELLDSVDRDSEKDARKQVCDAMARLDAAGNLEMK